MCFAVVVWCLYVGCCCLSLFADYCVCLVFDVFVCCSFVSRCLPLLLLVAVCCWLLLFVLLFVVVVQCLFVYCRSLFVAVVAFV